MDKKLYWASVVFAVIGVLISIYMTIYKLTDNERMCIGNGGCSTVNASAYSSIYGIPVAVFGILGYLAILVALTLEVKGGKFLRQNATLATFGMALIGFLFSFYLLYLEIYVIKALCPFCISSQIAISILFILSVVRLIKQPLN
jgi:uncharacterized membrane protein